MLFINFHRLVMTGLWAKVIIPDILFLPGEEPEEIVKVTAEEDAGKKRDSVEGNSLKPDDGDDKRRSTGSISSLNFNASSNIEKGSDAITCSRFSVFFVFFFIRQLSRRFGACCER